MCSAIPANHKPTASNEIIILRSHIAILKGKRHDEDSHVRMEVGMSYTRRTIIREANVQLAYADAYRSQDGI
jgi:hypothetical protein